MLQPIHPTWCEHCGAEIVDEGYHLEQKIFCCKACAEGEPCDCAERIIFEDERRESHHVPAYTTYGE